MVERDINTRWQLGIEHHPKSIELFKAISKVDYESGGDSFRFRCGGDGDNGETLMYLMDIVFECEETGEEI